MSVPLAHELPAELPVPELDSDFQLTLEQSLLPSPNSIELDRTPEKDFIDRLRMNRVQVGELFMENSKLSRVSGLNAVLDRQKLATTRDWYVATAYRPQADDFDEAATAKAGVRIAIADLPPPLSTFLAAVAGDERTAELLYAVDVFVLMGARSYRLSPKNPWLWLDRLFQPDEADRLMRAIQGVDEEIMRNAKALLAFVAVPVRYTLFQGPRGYRRTLADLGALLELCGVQAAVAGIELTVTLDQYENELDALLLLDGTERSVHAMGLLAPASSGDGGTR
jgi:hypothetical protein